LNIVDRRWWVRSYLEYYLSLVDGDRRGVLENGSLPRHFTMREEELLKISAVSLERLVTLLRQGVEGRLDDVAHVEVGSIDVEVSTLHA
jgi:hypothetical protein